jgi:hypothetical protein
MSNSTGRRRGFPAQHFRPLQFDVGFDLVLGEHAALQQEVVIGFQGFERFAQRTAHGRHLGQFGRRQVIEVLVHRLARVDLVLDPVEAGHQQRRIAQVGVGHRVGEAEFHALGLVARTVGDAARCRAVARRIGQQHRRFITRDQALVAVGGRVGEGVQRLGVLDDAADEIEAHVGQAGIAVAGEQRLALFPDRDVGVHARTVVLHDRLGHEGRGLAIGMGDLLDDVLVDLHAVGGL